MSIFRRYAIKTQQKTRLKSGRSIADYTHAPFSFNASAVYGVDSVRSGSASQYTTPQGKSETLSNSIEQPIKQLAVGSWQLKNENSSQLGRKSGIRKCVIRFPIHFLPLPTAYCLLPTFPFSRDDFSYCWGSGITLTYRGQQLSTINSSRTNHPNQHSTDN